jgi:hypothetical protein
MRLRATPARTSRAALAVSSGVLILLAGLPVPAAVAHGGDPSLVTVLDSISPALPADVIVQVRTTISEQVLVANPTRTQLEVDDPQGRPFLRVSRNGVLGDLADPFYHQTLNPPDVPPRLPAYARQNAKPHWAKISATSAWGWFEPRLHPFAPGAQPSAPPRQESDRTVLADWTIGMRYDGRPVTVAGVLAREPQLGSFQTTLDALPDGLQVAIGQGPVPALLLKTSPGVPVTVRGADGLPFLRVDDTGAYANPASRSFRETSAFANGPRQADGWARVGGPGAVSWTDPRLAYSADRPPAVVVKAERTALLGRWQIPITVGGQATNLTGTILWVPVGATPGLGGGKGGFPAWGWPLGALAVVVAGGLVFRNRRPAAR